MNRSGVCLVAWALVTAIAPVPGLYAQPTQDPKSGLYRVDGTVIAINKDKSTIKVRQKNRNNVVVTVSYTDDTRFRQLGEPATLDDVKDSRRVICLGSLDEKDGRRLIALEIDVRTPSR